MMRLLLHPKAVKLSYSTAFTEYKGSEARLPLLWRLPPSQLRVLKPHLLPCVEDGVGMFRVFLDRNSDGEFAVGQNTRRKHIFLYVTNRLSFFSRERPREAVGAAFAFQRVEHY